jgi:hypothetical protein
MIGRAPYIIGGADRPYLKRWWIVPFNRLFKVYLHQFLRSDDDRALHDHPWFNISILLRGSYIEHTPNGAHRRRAGDIVVRPARAAHRIELIEDAPVWTLFITGPNVRQWGFYCPNGWRHWRDFTHPDDSGEIGRGCD